MTNNKNDNPINRGNVIIHLINKMNFTQKIVLSLTIFLLVLWSILHNPFSGYTSQMVQGKNGLIEFIKVSNDAELRWINEPGEYWKYMIGTIILGVSIFFIFSNKKSIHTTKQDSEKSQE